MTDVDIPHLPPCDLHSLAQRRTFSSGISLCLECGHLLDRGGREIDEGLLLHIRRPLSHFEAERLQKALDQSIEETGTAIILKAPGVMTLAEHEQLRRLVEEWWDTKQEPEAIRG